MTIVVFAIFVVMFAIAMTVYFVEGGRELPRLGYAAPSAASTSAP